MNLTSKPLHNASDNITLGKQGERIAAIYLHKKGYRIIEMNFKKGYGELDIVCLYKDMLVFVEVKTRRGTEFGLPEEAVTPRKLWEVKKMALFYSSLHPELPQDLRIDVIGIQLNEMDTVTYFNHIENVTL